MALADHRERYQGLGDCFCMTDPSKADNPILYASDGFISVTGYSRKDIIPRNCRFLQGELTDPSATRRLRASIDNCEETVELLLNYRKNGDPFWNLLYVSPLFNERGEVSFFLGGQINCSTTIHSCTDVLRVLSANDDELDKQDEIAAMKNRPASIRSRDSAKEGVGTKTRSTFFKSWRKYNASQLPVASKINVREEAGMEGELLNRVAKFSLKTQVEAFYTAYSKVCNFRWMKNYSTDCEPVSSNELEPQHPRPPNPTLLPRCHRHALSQPPERRHRTYLQQRHLQSPRRALLFQILIRSQTVQINSQRSFESREGS